MKEFLKLIRWPNLLIVALTMILMRYAIIGAVIGKIEVTLYSIAGYAKTMSLQLPWYDFAVLVAATVFITAAGYVINDYFDVKTDLINKGRVIVGTSIPRKKALMWHNILNIIGVAGGFYVSWHIGYFWAGIMFLLVTGLFYFYSATYKRQFLVGNIMVAVLTGLLPLLVLFYEWIPLRDYYAVNAVKMPDFSMIVWWIGGFAFFAFITTLTREIIKDIEDFEGDTAFGRNTLPVVMGIQASKIVVVSLVIITMVMLYLIWYFFVNDIITFLYITTAVSVLLCYIIYLVISAHNSAGLHRASIVMKIVMITGLFYSVVVKIIISANLY
ncbi:MAG: geranylgeranylglycerol-phosphate geranylgeranyltransferase [Bacteroidales bacterium]